MTILESIRNYIKQCPYLEEFNGAVRVRVDFSKDDEATTYNIEEGVTSQPILKRYIDGSTVRQYLFIFQVLNLMVQIFNRILTIVAFMRIFNSG